MDDIGKVISFCWKLRGACAEGRIRPESVGVILSLADAEKIHAGMVSVNPGQDEIRVPWVRESKNSDFNVEEHSMVPKPHHPEAGEEWFRVFDIRVYVIG